MVKLKIARMKFILLILLSMIIFFTINMIANIAKSDEEKTYDARYDNKCKIPIVISRNNMVVMCGPMFVDAVNELNKHKDTLNKTHVLRITSQGGFASVAEEVLRIAKETNSKIEIDGYCFSACANIIFIGAKDLEVLKNSFVAFHYTTSYSVEILKKYPGRFGDINSSLLNEQAAEARVFKYKNIPYNVLLAIPSNLRTHCVKMPSGKEKVSSDYNWVIPTREQATNLRGEFDGYWANNLQELQRDIYKKSKYLKKGTIFKYGMDIKTINLENLCEVN